MQKFSEIQKYAKQCWKFVELEKLFYKTENDFGLLIQIQTLFMLKV